MTDKITATSTLRRAVYARSRKLNLGNMARDLGIPVDLLQNFGEGKGDLAPEVKIALTKDIFGAHIEFVPDADGFRSANKSKPTPAWVGPPPPAPVSTFDAKKYFDDIIDANRKQAAKSKTPVSKWKRIPGWIDGAA